MIVRLRLRKINLYDIDDMTGIVSTGLTSTKFRIRDIKLRGKLRAKTVHKIGYGNEQKKSYKYIKVSEKGYDKYHNEGYNYKVKVGEILF